MDYADELVDSSGMNLNRIETHQNRKMHAQRYLYRCVSSEWPPEERCGRTCTKAVNVGTTTASSSSRPHLKTLGILLCSLATVVAFSPLYTPRSSRHGSSIHQQPTRARFLGSAPRHKRVLHHPTRQQLHQVVAVSLSTDTQDENETMDDETLLAQVTTDQLQKLCEQCELPTSGEKAALLQRLRAHAAVEAEKSRQRNLERLQKVSDGSSDNSKERYEVVSEEVAENSGEDEGYFFFEDPGIDFVAIDQKEAKKYTRTTISSEAVTAPAPPIEPNENGERVVTVYSTTDQNDMTGIAASQPGMQAGSDTLNNAAAAASSATQQAQPWDMEQQRTSETTSRELEDAKAKVTELVSNLLSTTGAPAFRNLDGDEDSPYSNSVGFDGFDPSNVPMELLAKSSTHLRAGRGQVLQEVLRQFELQGIGQDGIAGDDVEKGGGHYREVVKVQAFLEGFRKAEVRKLARETTSLLLDKLVSEGVEGLDITLNSMVRSNDDTGESAGDLNDSLVDFLNDAIRQQEKKVDEVASARRSAEKVADWTEFLETDEGADDTINQLWNVTTQDGQRIETIDPNDPQVKTLLNEEALSGIEQNYISNVPESASEKLLLLLKLLRDRIKTEAAFAPDEKGRNLRLLAYCLRVASDGEIEQLILHEVGNSLDRLDSFLEMVASSSEYCESTSFELQPAKGSLLNMAHLEQIKCVVEDLQKRQARKASGLQP